jgi:hypothetical protein
MSHSSFSCVELPPAAAESDVSRVVLSAFTKTFKDLDNAA